MQKSSIKKLSILGLILAVASVVTAAVLPNREKSTESGVDKLVVSTVGGSPSGITCVPDGAENDCHASIDITCNGPNNGSSSTTGCAGCAAGSSSAKPPTSCTPVSGNTTM